MANNTIRDKLIRWLKKSLVLCCDSSLSSLVGFGPNTNLILPWQMNNKDSEILYIWLWATITIYIRYILERIERHKQRRSRVVLLLLVTQFYLRLTNSFPIQCPNQRVESPQYLTKLVCLCNNNKNSNNRTIEIGFRCENKLMIQAIYSNPSGCE